MFLSGKGDELNGFVVGKSFSRKKIKLNLGGSY